MHNLSTPRAVALYVGALLGPSLLLLPGLTVEVAGPAALLAWAVLLGLSGLLAWVFTALGVRIPLRSGAAGYVGAAFGPRAERATAAVFVVSVIVGTPVIALIGGSYISAATGGGTAVTALAAAVMLLIVLVVTTGGVGISSTAQLALVGLLLVLVLVAVLGAAPHAQAASFIPFLPHGWAAVASATTLLMLSFVGWEAIAPLVARLHSPARQLPRITATAFAITAVVYLGLTATLVGALGARAGTHTPVAALLTLALGRVGAISAAMAAVALTLSGTTAYVTAAREMTTRTSSSTRLRSQLLVPVATAAAGVLELTGISTHLLTTAQLVAIPTVMLVVVYIGCAFAALGLLRGPVRAAAGLATACTTAIGLLSGPVLVVPIVVAVVAALLPQRGNLHAKTGAFNV